MASELSSSDAPTTSTSASDGDAPTAVKAPTKKVAKATKKSQQPQSGSDGDAALRKEVKKLQVETKKAKAMADNLKKKLKQDAARTKALQDKIKALEDENKAIMARDPHAAPQPEPEPEPPPMLDADKPTTQP